MEPLSPELALIDPDLRRADIARLAARPFVVVPTRVRPIGPPPAATVRRSWPRRAAQVVALLGLLAAGVLVANVAARDSSDGPVLETNPTVAPSTSAPVEAAAPLVGRAAVERALLQLVVQAPAGRLPSALVDPRTGLAVNNLQAVCHGAGHGYLCLVRPALHKAGEGLRVRYGANGFTWFRYRTG